MSGVFCEIVNWEVIDAMLRAVFSPPPPTVSCTESFKGNAKGRLGFNPATKYGDA